MKKNPLFIIIPVIALVVVAIVAVIFTRLGGNEVATATPSPIIQEKFNTMEVTKRPYVTLAPTNKGRSLTLTLQTLNAPATKGEFEVEYQSGTLLQGFGGKLNIAKLPDVQEFLLGSCSAGGKCSYSEDVTGGALTIRLTDTEKQSLKNEWSFLENKEKSDTVTSRDGKFVLTGKGIASVSHWVVLQSPGYPAPIEKPLSAVYAPAGLTVAKGEFKVGIRLSEDVPTATVWAWDGKAYKPLKTTITERVAYAPSPVVYESYVVVAE
jgi:hypothetical protein